MAFSSRATLHYGAHQILRGFVSGRLSVAKVTFKFLLPAASSG